MDGTSHTSHEEFVSNDELYFLTSSSWIERRIGMDSGELTRETAYYFLEFSSETAASLVQVRIQP
jgi:hypothetical protein